MAEHTRPRSPLWLAEPPRRGCRLESRREIEAWAAERLRVLTALVEAEHQIESQVSLFAAEELAA
jgi:hypothetical protein